MPEVTLFLGPPGTGKTERLGDQLARELEAGVRPDRVAALSFTKKATEVFRSRAMERFGFSESDCPWFRTVHSLAFSRLGLKRSEVMGQKHYDELGRALGLKFGGQVIEEGPAGGRQRGDRYAFLDGFARARRISLEQAWRECLGDADVDLNLFELVRFRRTLTEYKKDRGLVDYSDMLELPQAPIDVDVVVVDEAQDLSTLQWDYLEEYVFAGADRIYIAGDDDQAVYEWSGADVGRFQNIEACRVVLDVSHRVPGSIHRVANRISSGIAKRVPKAYSPKVEEGLVRYYGDPDAVDLDAPGSWLLLARNNYLLPQLTSMVRSQGFTYSLRGESAVNPRHTTAMLAYERWRSGKAQPTEEDVTLCEAMGAKWSGAPWHEELVKIPRDDREWYASVRRRGGSLFQPPRISIGTIHSVKGGEADHVMLLTDVSASTWSASGLNRDAELRVWYVGVTRGRSTLHVVRPQGQYGWDI